MADLHEFKKNQENQRNFEASEENYEPHKTQNSESMTRSIMKKETAAIEKEPIMVRTVSYEEIHLAAKELKFNLMINRIALDDALKVEFTLLKVSIYSLLLK